VRLLVSVRSAAEVEVALDGGAEIIDAKEPRHGSLGAVSPAALVDILAAVPPQHAVSVALGDLTTPEEASRAIALLPLGDRAAPIYLKLGFAGVASLERVQPVIAAALEAAGQKRASIQIVPVAYADAHRAGAPAPDAILRLSARSRVAGILLDTHTKDGLALPKWMEPPLLVAWVSRARDAGLLTALAGGLKLEDVAPVSAAEPDIIGVRGAACEGGRDGRISVERVRALRERLEVDSGSVQAPAHPLLLAGSRNA
jgi:(5-formylfuran-3-yl)methyl phosphate synthase